MGSNDRVGKRIPDGMDVLGSSHWRMGLQDQLEGDDATLEGDWDKEMCTKIDVYEMSEVPQDNAVRRPEVF
jgi:hypothetical protein